MEEKLVLVGVGHVFDISTQIKEVIDAVDPDAVALELDKNRLQFLLSPVKNKKSPNFLYFILSKIQEKIAKKYGVTTGSEMLSAAAMAKDKGIDILCIDKD
ncbi:MAG TPA: TraB family protein, partial [Methanomicrobia archaeon]|nr:TraB family protein [Methanomicrobia archaeon]